MARYAVVKDGWEWTNPADLSLVNGARAEWKPDGSWIGHYIRGGFHADANAFNYIALWPQNGVPTMNVVSVSRASAAAPLQKSAPWGSAKPAPLNATYGMRVRQAPRQDRDDVVHPQPGRIHLPARPDTR